MDAFFGVPDRYPVSAMRHTSAPPTSNIDPWWLRGSKMGLNAQEQFAQSDVTRNVQNGGRSDMVQLKALIFQKPSKERMDWKSKSP